MKNSIRVFGAPAWLRHSFAALASRLTRCALLCQCLLLTASLSLSRAQDPAPSSLFTEEEWVHLFAALITVESGGRDSAHNLRENARGCLQVRAGVILDYARGNPGRPFHHTEMHDRAKALRVARWYLEYYATRALKRHWGRRSAYEVAARTWNGGPNGSDRAATDIYWAKVKALLPQ